MDHPGLEGSSEAKHQAAGHPGCLTLDDGAMFVKSTTPQEVAFYTELSTEPVSGAPGSRLSDWTPSFMGTLTEGNLKHDPNSARSEYIVLHNIYNGFVKPSILDIKLGSKLTDDSTTAREKIDRLAKVSQQTTSGSLGFRICGMKLYNGSEKVPNPLFPDMDSTISITKDEGETYLEFNKFFGRSLTAQTAPRALELFFCNYFTTALPQPLAAKVAAKLATVYLQRLQLLYNCLLDYEIRIYSGSLLFTFENDLQRWGGSPEEIEKNLGDAAHSILNPLVPERVLPEEEEDDDEVLVPLSCLNLIDLAHAKFVKGQGYDENVLDGVEKLMEVLQTVIDKLEYN